MKLPKNTSIAQEKLIKYLLVLKNRNDKSQWLAKAGYNLENWKILENDLRNQILSIDAIHIENTEYGQMYEIRGKLEGPNGKSLTDCTIWMSETQQRAQNLLRCILIKGNKSMAYKLFEEVSLTQDIPEKKLIKGDVATIVEHHPVSEGEDGYSLEIFNALGDTVTVITVAESSIEPITKDEIFNVRSLVAA